MATFNSSLADASRVFVAVVELSHSFFRKCA